MVIIKPLKVLVCLAIILTCTSNPAGWGYNGSDVSGGIQGDALSADPVVQPSRQYRFSGQAGHSLAEHGACGPPFCTCTDGSGAASLLFSVRIFSPTAQLSTADSILSARTPGIWSVSTGGAIWADLLRNPPVPAQDRLQTVPARCETLVSPRVQLEHGHLRDRSGWRAGDRA